MSQYLKTKKLLLSLNFIVASLPRAYVLSYLFSCLALYLVFEDFVRFADCLFRLNTYFFVIFEFFN